MAQIASREVKGLAWESYIIIRSLGAAPWDDARVGFGLLALAACIVGSVVDTRASSGHLCVWTILLWLLFAWYVPIAAGERCCGVRRARRRRRSCVRCL